jgi:hypothetical protein
MFQSSFYKIPRFQRPYSWDRGNIEDFWSDVVSSGEVGHFIGSMVIYAGPGEDKFVVDGQQRLTTIIIFLAALRDALAAAGEEQLARGIQGIIERQDLAAEKRYVIRSETSYPYLQENILKFGAAEVDLKPTDEEKGLQSAFEYAKRGFDEAVKKIRNTTGKTEAWKKREIKKRLESYRDALLSLDVITIELDDEDAAYIVFETLNTRGRDLEPKDLIKNHLAKLLPKQTEVDSTREKWDKMLDALAANEIDVSTFLHHQWLSVYEYTPERALFKAVKDKIKKASAKAYLNSLVADVDRYRRIVDPVSFKWKKEEDPVKASLQALRIFKVTQPTPMILALLRALDEKRISLKQARDAIGDIERFHFMYTAVAGQSSSGGVSKMYAAAARELTKEQDDQKRAKVLTDLRAKLRARIPEKSAIDAGLRELRYGPGEARNKPLIRYILEKLDASMRTDAAADYSKMTIEHLAPQNPPPGAVAVSLAPTIGNLVLVSEALNGKLRNKPFQDKLKALIDARVPLDNIIKNAKEWSDTEIDTRTEQIAQTLRKL